MHRVLQSRTANDELVAGPSGLGYMYPTFWPDDLVADYAQLTAEAMRDAGMRLINTIGQNDDPPNATIMAPYIASEQVDGLLFYPWGDGYAGLRGKTWTIGNKLAVSARYSLWGDGSSGEMLNVTAMIEALKSQPKTPDSSEGYSLVAVHAWS